MKFSMIDLCSGLCGASKAMKQRGWKVVTIDIDKKFKPDIVADVRDIDNIIEKIEFVPDLLWASPPCEEFTREFLPWAKTGQEPDLSILKACIEIKNALKPKSWIFENVKGAVKWFKPFLGKPQFINNPYYLWGEFPLRSNFKIRRKNKESYSSKQKSQRAKIPYRLSLAIAVSIEQHISLI